MKPAIAILELIAHADQKSLEKVFSIAICRQSNSCFTRPPIHALHSINPVRCYEEDRYVF